MHTNHISHGNIKPNNILFRKDMKGTTIYV